MVSKDANARALAIARGCVFVNATRACEAANASRPFLRPADNDKCSLASLSELLNSSTPQQTLPGLRTPQQQQSRDTSDGSSAATAAEALRQHCCYDAPCSTGATMHYALALLCSGTQGTERCLPVVLRLMLRLLIVRAQQQPLDPVQRRVVVVLRT